MTKQQAYTEEFIEFMPTFQFWLLVATLDLLVPFFDGNHEKVALWMNTKNPLLGNVTPAYFFFRDRGHKVYKFVYSSLEENKP